MDAEGRGPKCAGTSPGPGQRRGRIPAADYCERAEPASQKNNNVLGSRYRLTSTTSFNLIRTLFTWGLLSNAHAQADPLKGGRREPSGPLAAKRKVRANPPALSQNVLRTEKLCPLSATFFRSDRKVNGRRALSFILGYLLSGRRISRPTRGTAGHALDTFV
jgi:hypothetical protein